MEFKLLCYLRSTEPVFRERRSVLTKKPCPDTGHPCLILSYEQLSVLHLYSPDISLKELESNNCRWLFKSYWKDQGAGVTYKKTKQDLNSGILTQPYLSWRWILWRKAVGYYRPSVLLRFQKHSWVLERKVWKEKQDNWKKKKSKLAHKRNRMYLRWNHSWHKIKTDPTCSPVFTSIFGNNIRTRRAGKPASK